MRKQILATKQSKARNLTEKYFRAAIPGVGLGVAREGWKLLIQEEILLQTFFFIFQRYD